MSSHLCLYIHIYIHTHTHAHTHTHTHTHTYILYVGFQGKSASKEPVYNAGNPSSIPGQEDPLEKG